MEELKRSKIIKITDIVRQFDVSNETARRDLEALQDLNLIKRIYGGAVLASATSFDSIYTPRASLSQNEKAAIGKAAADMISEGDTIILDIGTTTLEIARNIKTMRNVTILTNSLAIMNELAGSDLNVFCLGGKLNVDELSLSGDLTANALKNFFVDKAFIGAGGVTFTEGVSDYNNDEAIVRRTVIQRANKVILVADSGKFGSNAFAFVCPIESIHTIVSDENLADNFVSGIRERKIELLLVKPDETPSI
jgi:DeoR/GlpR family transcriptional regulator of sugar metabolism